MRGPSLSGFKPGSHARSAPISRKGPLPNQFVTAIGRICTECGQTKPLSGFLRIKATKAGYYGRCRMCRNAKARARYHSNEPARLAEIERSKRNSLKRKLLAVSAVMRFSP